MTHLTFLFSENSNIYPKNVDCNRPPPFPCKIIIKQINNSIQDIFLMGFKFEQYVYFLVKNTLNFYLFQQSLYTIKFVLYIYIYIFWNTQAISTVRILVHYLSHQLDTMWRVIALHLTQQIPLISAPFPCCNFHISNSVTF